MNRHHYYAASIVMAFIMIAMGCSAKERETPRSGDSSRLDKNMCSPIGVRLELKGADIEKGLTFRAEIDNRGSIPHALTVCPHMLMSWVVGAHLLARQDDWSVGLLDVCEAPKPSAREALLPPNASYGFDLTVPAARLPQNLRDSGRGFSVQLLYEIEDQNCAQSNVVQVGWN